MDKNAIKKYAVWARRELIEKVSQKALQYGIEDGKELDPKLDSINGVLLTDDEKKQRQALIRKINENGYTQVMEEVAYTWFNRFIALRVMEVNGYLPSHVRVFTDEAGEFKPQIMSEALHLELKGLDNEKVYELKNDNKDDELFKYLLITQCNDLSEILPKMFQKISDYTELLLPDYLLREGSVIERMVIQGTTDSIPESDWTDQVQIIGWLYQYYNSEPKDKVFADLKKNIKITKENIPAATQLFTPDWIVHYMVENSLGRLWLEGHPNNDLKSEWKYYLDEAEQEGEVQAQLEEIRKEYATLEPGEIRVIDPCSGSGHILCVLFDVLVCIYEDYGYTAREAAASIIQNNIWGIDIDERASQLSYFTIMMKARQYDRRFLTKQDENGNPDIPQPHVYVIEESNGIAPDCVEYFVDGRPELKNAIASIIKEMHDAKEYGSIINVSSVDFKALYARFIELKNETTPDIFTYRAIEELLPLVNVGQVLAQKYHSIVTNPPYMGGSMNRKLYNYVEKIYPNSKLDLFAVFIERCMQFSLKFGTIAMITPETWMFLSSYGRLRKSIIDNNSISSLTEYGTGAFETGFGTVAFCINNAITNKYRGNYIDLRTVDNKEEQLILNKRFQVQTKFFYELPDCVIAYWCSEKMAKILHGKTIGENFELESGIVTGNNVDYLRYWFEVSAEKIALNDASFDMMQSGRKKWFKCNKGGGYNKWYGNYEYIVDLEFGAANIKAKVDPSIYRLRKPENYFLEGINWPLIGVNKFSAKYTPSDVVNNKAANSVHFKDEVDFCLLAYLNTTVYNSLLNMINPTVNYPLVNISNSPSYTKIDKLVVSSLGKECVDISKEDWDSFETSWDFEMHPFIKVDRSNAINGGDFAVANTAHYYEEGPEASCPIEASFMLWKGECNARFHQLKENEEELNRIFIDIYGLEDELSPEVEDKDVTVRMADLQRDIRSFISYAVGCMFGRYSLDVPGLAYAGGDWDASKYKTFQADSDAIIPICDDEYFEDDIVGRFVKFIEVVYGKDTLEDNLKFIADALGGNGTSREVIRNYFINDFYADHVKVYQKRPIYWLFDSGKKNGFKCLIYMHRYQPDTIARIRTDYVHEQQARYRTAIEEIEKRIDSASQSDKVKLTKKLNTLKDQDEEIHAYEEKIHHLADQMISIDLDDGVKHNYALFQDVLAKIK